MPERPAIIQRTGREAVILTAIGEAPRRGFKPISEKYAAFLRAREYAARFPNGQNADYNINIPGIQDIIRIPHLEDRALRRQRYIRFNDSVSPVPEALQWIAPVLNKLDDAQDLLFTALVLARPLVRAFPRFLMGPLGFGLLINDLLNIFT